MAQLVKNLPAVQESSVQFLVPEDLLEKGAATHSSILAWRATVHGVAKSRTRLSATQPQHVLRKPPEEGINFSSEDRTAIATQLQLRWKIRNHIEEIKIESISSKTGSQLQR